MKFGDNLSQKVDMTRINLDCIRPWVINRITELLNFEDEVVCNYVLNQLEERHPDPKEIQINITGFLNSKNARIFLTELWDHLLSAMNNSEGIPTALLDAKKAEIAKRQDEEKWIASELRRKEEELRLKSVSSNSRTTGNSGTVGGQTNNTTNGNANASTNEVPPAADKFSSKGGNSRHSRSPSSPQHESSKKDETPLKRERDDSSRHRRRRRHHSRSSSGSSSSGDRDRDRIREPRRHYRSRSRSNIERPVKKPPAPDSDWRKDLMAGRRRSPPEMPENSYYGRLKERKRSRDRREHHRSHRSPRHASPLDSSADRHRRRHRSRSRGDQHSDDEFYRHQYQRHHNRDRNRQRSRSPVAAAVASIARSELEARSIADRANKYHNRRAQWAQEADELVDEQMDADHGRHRKSRHVESEMQPRRKRNEVPMPDEVRRGLPPSREPDRFKAKQQVIPKPPSPSSSSSSEEESGESSSSSSASSSSESSSEEGEEENETAPEHTPEGPALPPPPPPAAAIPEGPALPPTMDGAPKWADEAKHNSSGGSSAGSSSESSESADSSSSSSSSGASSSESEDERSHGKTHTIRSVAKRVHSPEGPTLPPSPRKSQSQATARGKHQRKPEVERSKGMRDQSPEETAEEALRRRALASLIRASGDRRRHKSPS